ncbi:hypothetical protein LF1_52740 [Rubripirellula obstinata]|uniref:Uncharacterized protein n=1 Tax=Rubripirellula obstinata TaxID=406547 RepID=A0A5B1CBP8_9BACT|nr:hypothetical protein LF1_52740 [Rubripirellula obstinata]
MIATHRDEVCADALHRNGVLRITIACTGVAAAHFSLCLHVKSRHLGDAYRYPTGPRTFAARLAPCGAQPMLDQNGFAPNARPTPKCRLPCGASTDARIPMLNQRRRTGCTAWHQPTPVFPNSIYCLPPKLALPATLCYAFRTVTVTHMDGVRADGSRRNGVLRITIACTGVAAAHFPLCLHVKSRHLGDAYRYPTEPRTLAACLAPCGAQPTLDQHRFAPNALLTPKCRPPCGASTDA